MSFGGDLNAENHYNNLEMGYYFKFCGVSSIVTEFWKGSFIYSFPIRYKTIQG